MTAGCFLFRFLSGPYNRKQKCIECVVKYNIFYTFFQKNLSIEGTLTLFESLVLLILLYGCKILGFENTNIIENIHVSFMCHILSVKN